LETSTQGDPGQLLVDRFQLVPASYIVFRREDNVLLQLRRGTGYMDGHWSSAAAGHVEANESAVQGAVREAHEELGVSIDPDKLIPLTVIHRTEGNGHAIGERVDFFFECRTWQGEPRMMEPDKIADLRWFHLDDLPSVITPHERCVFEGLRTGIPPIVTLGFT
jgi:8-oxo-dGTP pyrophosphatase MutT (NUDIX family)